MWYGRRVFADFERFGASCQEVVLVRVIHPSEGIEPAELPVFDWQVMADGVNRLAVEKQEVGVRRDAACKMLAFRKASVAPAVDQTGEIADICASEIADLAYVEGNSTFSFQSLEVMALKAADESGAIS